MLDPDLSEQAMEMRNMQEAYDDAQRRKLQADTAAMRDRMRADTIVCEGIVGEPEGFFDDDDRDYGVDYIDPAEAHMFGADDVGSDDGSLARERFADEDYRDRFASGQPMDEFDV